MAASSRVHRARDRIESRVRFFVQGREPGQGIALLEGGAVAEGEPRRVFGRHLDAKIDIRPRPEVRMELEDLGDGIDAIALDAEQRPQAPRRQGGDADPVARRDV